MTLTMNPKGQKSKDKADWKAIEALESIANQCIYKGKEVAQARALLKALYNLNPEYDDADEREEKTYDQSKHPKL